MNFSKAGLQSGVWQLRERLAELGSDGLPLLQAHEQLALLLEQRRMCVWTTDSAPRLTSTAGAVEALLGSAIDPGQSTDLPDLLGDTDPIVEATRGALAGRESQRTIQSGGRVYAVFISPLRDSVQALTGTFASAVDITDAEATRQLLSNREQRFRDLVENANDLLYAHDLRGQFTSVNHAIERMFGYPATEALRMSLTDLLAPEVREETIDRLRAMVGGATPQNWEAAAYTRSGKRLVLELSSRLVLVDGNPVAIEGIARDVTERRMLEEHVRQSQKMEAIGVLAGGIAHDFNNLLTGILGYAYLLQAEPEVNSRAADALDVIVRSAERAAQLTTQLLGFARRGKTQNVALDVHSTVRDLAGLLQRTIDKRIRIIPQLRATRSHVMGDPGQIYQLLLNLCLNGRDAIAGNGQITITTRNAGSNIVIAVQDTGEGIPPELRERIFEPFFTTKPPDRGTGMGLAMVYGIARNHGGAVSLDSQVGVGSTFSVTLPLCPETAPEVRSKSWPESGRGSVLVIDDEDIVRQVLSRMLTGLGYEVTTAGDSRNAVEYYREHWRDVDAVIIDMVMPRMGGRECYLALREINPNLRVVLSSGYSREDEAAAIAHERGVEFLQKPYQLDQLATALHRAMAAGGPR